MNPLMRPLYELEPIDALYVFLTDMGKKKKYVENTYLENESFFTDVDAKKLRRRKLQY